MCEKVEERVTRCPVCKRPVIVYSYDRSEYCPEIAEFQCSCGAMGTVDWERLKPRLREVSGE